LTELGSISSTFYSSIFHTKFWCQKLQSWNVTRESCAICFCTKKARVKCWWNWLLGLISSKFYAQLLRWYSFTKKLQSQAVIREKLQIALLYEKGSRVKCWWNWHLVECPCHNWAEQQASKAIKKIIIETGSKIRKSQDQPSISSTFYVHVFRTKVFSYFCQSQNVKKGLSKTLMKLTTSVPICKQYSLLEHSS